MDQRVTTVIISVLLLLLAGCGEQKQSLDPEEVDNSRMIYLLLDSIDVWQANLDTETSARRARQNLITIEHYQSEYTHLSTELNAITRDFVEIGYERLAHQERMNKHRDEMARVIKDPQATQAARQLVMLDNERLLSERDSLVERGQAWYKRLMAATDDPAIPKLKDAVAP